MKIDDGAGGDQHDAGPEIFVVAQRDFHLKFPLGRPQNSPLLLNSRHTDPHPHRESYPVEGEETGGQHRAPFLFYVAFVLFAVECLLISFCGFARVVFA